jgi:pimeloyl-ACP methyl ester carboxylesterase
MGARAALVALTMLGLAAAPASAAPLKRCRGEPGARCGAIRVPVHRSDPTGPKLTVRFRVYPRRDRSRPALKPIVAAEGGPGYSTIESASGYELMLRPLLARRDMIVMDNRGTGRSGAIDCPRLQNGRGNYVREVGRCGRKLGRASDAYGTGAAADDLAAVLDRLRVPVVSIYGDSYGTYFAQAFAVRHPARVRAVVLDAAFAVTAFDPWEREQLETIRFAWRAICERSGACRGDPLAEMGALARRLEAKPLVGRSRDADGTMRRVRIDGREIALWSGDGSFYYAIYRDLLAAGRAYERGDPAPLLRLGAESAAAYEPGSDPTSYSEGAYAAVACNDYPNLWAKSASFSERREQLTAARAQLPADTFSPFPLDMWLSSTVEHQLVHGCLSWPAPRVLDPPVPAGASFPTVPVLVLDGDLDSVTPRGDSEAAAALFPNSRLVIVQNVGHVTAVADFDHCGSALVRRFLTDLDPGDTSCAREVPELHVVPKFPVRVAQAPAAQPSGPTDRSNRRDRRAAWVAARTIGDAWSRWWLMYGSDGHGLRGGRFTAGGAAYYSYGPVSLRLKGVRYASDLRVSGRAVWDRRKARYRATLHPAGARRGRLRVAWPSRADATARITGRLGGRTVRLRTPAP